MFRSKQAWNHACSLYGRVGYRFVKSWKFLRTVTPNFRFIAYERVFLVLPCFFLRPVRSLYRTLYLVLLLCIQSIKIMRCLVRAQYWYLWGKRISSKLVFARSSRSSSVWYLDRIRWGHGKPVLYAVRAIEVSYHSHVLQKLSFYQILDLTYNVFVVVVVVVVVAFYYEYNLR